MSRRRNFRHFSDSSSEDSDSFDSYSDSSFSSDDLQVMKRYKTNQAMNWRIPREKQRMNWDGYKIPQNNANKGNRAVVGAKPRFSNSAEKKFAKVKPSSEEDFIMSPHKQRISDGVIRSHVIDGAKPAVTSVNDKVPRQNSEIYGNNRLSRDRALSGEDYVLSPQNKKASDVINNYGIIYEVNSTIASPNHKSGFIPIPLQNNKIRVAIEFATDRALLEEDYIKVSKNQTASDGINSGGIINEAKVSSANHKILLQNDEIFNPNEFTKDNTHIDNKVSQIIEGRRIIIAETQQVPKRRPNIDTNGIQFSHKQPKTADKIIRSEGKSSNWKAEERDVLQSNSSTTECFSGDVEVVSDRKLKENTSEQRRFLSDKRSVRLNDRSLLLEENSVDTETEFNASNYSMTLRRTAMTMFAVIGKQIKYKLENFSKLKSKKRVAFRLDGDKDQMLCDVIVHPNEFSFDKEPSACVESSQNDNGGQYDDMEPYDEMESGDDDCLLCEILNNEEKMAKRKEDLEKFRETSMNECSDILEKLEGMNRIFKKYDKGGEKFSSPREWRNENRDRYDGETILSTLNGNAPPNVQDSATIFCLTSPRKTSMDCTSCQEKEAPSHWFSKDQNHSAFENKEIFVKKAVRRADDISYENHVSGDETISGGRTMKSLERSYQSIPTNGADEYKGTGIGNKSRDSRKENPGTINVLKSSLRKGPKLLRSSTIDGTEQYHTKRSNRESYHSDIENNSLKRSFENSKRRSDNSSNLSQVKQHNLEILERKLKALVGHSDDIKASSRSFGPHQENLTSTPVKEEETAKKLAQINSKNVKSTLQRSRSHQGNATFTNNKRNTQKNQKQGFFKTFFKRVRRSLSFEDIDRKQRQRNKNRLYRELSLNYADSNGNLVTAPEKNHKRSRSHDDIRKVFPYRGSSYSEHMDLSRDGENMSRGGLGLPRVERITLPVGHEISRDRIETSQDRSIGNGSRAYEEDRTTSRGRSEQDEKYSSSVAANQSSSSDYGRSRFSSQCYEDSDVIYGVDFFDADENLTFPPLPVCVAKEQKARRKILK